MRIIFSGYHNPRFPTITEYIEEAFADRGHTVLPFDDRRYLFPGRLRSRFPVLERLDVGRMNRSLLRMARDFRPDLVVVSGGHRILPETIRSVRQAGTRAVLWTIDAPADFGPVAAAAPTYDRVFFGGSEAQALLQKAGVEDAVWLPFACSPHRHRPVTLDESEKSRYACDVAFVGSYYPNRAEVLSSLAGMNIGIWGPGWDRLPAGHALRPRIRGAHTPYCEWIKIYSAATIVLVVHFRDPEIPCDQASPKVFEAMSCGASDVCDDQRDVLQLFKSSEHLFVFSHPGELRPKLEALLADAPARSRVSRAGKAEAQGKHTYDLRVAKLLANVRK